MSGLTYAGSGVDYTMLDPFKRKAMEAAAGTDLQPARLNMWPVTASRGESVFLIQADDRYIAHVEEGLGTKNIVAEECYRATGNPIGFYNVAMDTVCMIVNDMATLGALPVSTAMHLAVGSTDWFKDEGRYEALISGWRAACQIARCCWGGGETPTLRDIINPDHFVLNGSAVGTIKPKRLLIQGDVAAGDAIIVLKSSGLHANGFTLARDLAKLLPRGYQTRVTDRHTYGELLLNPTVMYSTVVEDCLAAGALIKYCINITGHGWRKLMRLIAPFAYVVDTLPEKLPIFDFIQGHGEMSDREMYQTFNMGGGYALIVDPISVETCLKVIRSNRDSDSAYLAGYVEASDERRVVLKTVGIEYRAEELQIR